MQVKLIAEDLTYSIIGGGQEVYNNLRLGFLEHVYVMALERELRARGHRVAREVSIMISYKGEELTTQRMDMLVDDTVIIEVKSGLRLHESASQQLYNYLRATRIEVGLLFFFGPKGLSHFRVVCSNPESSVTQARAFSDGSGTLISADPADRRR
ncbi:MAG TPA: GxxExxY protein [Gemmatimonadaceae bacterium]|nr:GxxExxY protein [Gemmatimonadaceae bacterium]